MAATSDFVTVPLGTGLAAALSTTRTKPLFMPSAITASVALAEIVANVFLAISASLVRAIERSTFLGQPGVLNPEFEVLLRNCQSEKAILGL